MTVIRGIAALAVVVFVFCPLSTVTQILVFVASIVVFLICHSVLTDLDEAYADKYGPTGYWPSKPIDWRSGSRRSADRSR